MAQAETALAADFTPRACPACGSPDARVLLRVRAPDLFAANWSYVGAAGVEVMLADEVFPIGQCAACGFVFATRLPGPGFLRVLYDEVIDTAAAERSNLGPHSVALKMRMVASLLLLLPDAADRRPRVLDYGCGFGATLALLAAAGVEAHGFETSATRVRALRARGLQVSDSHGELAGGLPFDALILDNVLEHLPDPRGTLHGLRRMCTPAAIACVRVPDAPASLVAAQEGVLSGGGRLRMDVNPWEHLNYFDLPGLDRIMGGCGFVPVPQSQLPQAVDIGVRPERSLQARLRNALASAPRLARYALRGDALASPTARFYRAA